MTQIIIAYCILIISCVYLEAGAQALPIVGFTASLITALVDGL